MSKKKLTQERLKEVLHYNPDTGIFIWKKTGKIAGNMDHKGYNRIGIDYSLYRSARLAFLYMTGKFPPVQADHKNRIRNDDRWCNLRPATNLENSKNRTVKSACGIDGISWNKAKNKWAVYIRIDGIKKHLGYFKDIESAKTKRLCFGL